MLRKGEGPTMLLGEKCAPMKISTVSSRAYSQLYGGVAKVDLAASSLSLFGSGANS
jgi:hypothetical protein